MTASRRRLVPTLLVVLGLALAGRAGAQPYDHLECYKIKDFQPKRKYTATLTPEQTQFLTQTGCQLKVPAKLLCINVAKSNVVPAPPLALNGADTRNFLCYNLKCPKLDLPFQFEDQFGSRNVTVKKPHQLCAPAREVGDPGPPTPTPCLPAPTPTPTATPAPSCMDLMQNGGETDVDCGGPCPPCLNGEGCASGSDCQSGICTGGTCTFCNPGQQQSCGTMLPGACSMGTQVCLVGGNAFGPCQGPPPGTETCNGIDDDCNGIVDDNSCPAVPNAGGTCNGMSCSYTCDPGYGDCNGNPTADGCEADLLTSNQHCGGCNVFCPGMCSAGICALGNGSSCSTNGQCQSGNCVDGVCCNTSCAATCQACSSAKTMAMNGVCANIPNGTDPDNECPGMGTCNGAGACQP